MNHTVIGVFDTKTQANNAREALIQAGYSNDDIDVNTYGESGEYGPNYETHHRSTLVNWFRDLFDLDENDSTRYADVAGRGTVLTVYTDKMAMAEKAGAIIDRFDSIDFDERCNVYDTGNFAANAEGIIEVVEENIAIGKREVETGGVTVRSRIIEKPVTETLRLRTEEVFVHRTPVDRPATGDVWNDTTIKVKETAEEAVVEKNARIVEEISVGKDVDTRTETIKETVRETEVDVVENAGTTVRTHAEKKKFS